MENTKLKKLSQTDKIISDITSAVPDLGLLAVTSPDAGNFVAGDTVHLKAESLCMEETGLRQSDWYASPGIWLRVKDPSGDIVFDQIIQDYDKTAGSGEIVYVTAGKCYSWSGDWNIPSNIGGEEGKYTFKIWEVIEKEDNDELFESPDLAGRWEKISDAETAQFSIDPGEPEDRPPDAEIELTTDNPKVGDSVTFSALKSTDDHGIKTYFWWPDGNKEAIKSTSTEGASFTFSEPGKHTATVEVRDSSGQRSQDTVTFYVAGEQNKKPTADIFVSKVEPKVGESVKISGKGSSDPDGKIVSYDWSLGRNVKVFDHVFQQPGRTTVELTVTDNQGATDTTTFTIDVEQKPPEAVATVSNSNPTAGETVTFSADQSNGEILAYVWSVGNQDRKNIQHSFDTPGTKTVTLTVKNDAGSDTDTVTVDVQPRDTDGDGIPDPEDVCDNEGDQGFGLKDNGCPIKDTDDDGIPDPDDDCRNEEGIQELNGCANDKPEVSNFILSQTTAKTGETLTAEVTASDANGQDLQYTWSIPGNQVGDTANPSFSFKKTGTKTITVEISDGITSVTREQTVDIVQPEPEPPATNETVEEPGQNQTTEEPGTGEPPSQDETTGDGTDETGQQNDLGPVQSFFFGIIDFIGGIL